MKIAIVGSGISGLTCAWLLQPYHDIVVFEAGSCIGGHTHTVDVDHQGEQHAIDTGFIVYNDRTYPNFIRLLDRLNVASQPTSMSFSVRCDRTGIEYNGTNLNGVFAQRRNLVRPRFVRMLRDILRFNRESPALLDQPDEDLLVKDYIDRYGYSRAFAEQYLIPMGAAIWSCPPETFGRFPMRFIVEFYRNHGLLSLRNRPQWRVITGGSRNYVDRLTAGFPDRIRLNSPVVRVDRTSDQVIVSTPRQEPEAFDHVVFACHSDQALRILGGDATPTETQVLSEFPYQANSAVLHTDAGIMPKRRRAWASWNYTVPQNWPGEDATVTYYMNMLQSLTSQHSYLVTLNCDDRIDPARVLGRFEYHHPIYTMRRRAAQQRHSELIDRDRTSFCGAYWGYGFHEDGVNSALAVCRKLEPRASIDKEGVR